jgi:hypothetical protein
MRDKDGADTLLELADLLGQVSELLYFQPNANRLSKALADDTSYGGGYVSVHDFQRLVFRFEDVARAAHRGRGKPPDQEKLNLTLAYRLLADFWMKQEGADKFTNDWHNDPKDGLRPNTDAARFLFDALKEIDPDRPDLAKELRQLMAKSLPGGKRRGRKRHLA